MTTIIQAEFARLMWPKMKQRWRRFYSQKTKAPKRARRNTMSTKQDRKDLDDAIDALRAASSAIWGGFTWMRTPEGHDYWKQQAKHMVALADQLQLNKKAYLRD